MLKTLRNLSIYQEKSTRNTLKQTDRTKILLNVGCPLDLFRWILDIIKFTYFCLKYRTQCKAYIVSHKRCSKQYWSKKVKPTQLRYSQMEYVTKCFCTKYVNYYPFLDVSFPGVSKDMSRGKFLRTEQSGGCLTSIMT